VSSRPKAFISYSTRYSEWVDVLHRNLERALGEGAVFLDRTAIGVGQSFVARLQQGLDRSRHVILVATPEAFASPWVLESQWAELPEHLGERRILPLLLVDTPFPPLLKATQFLDFREADVVTYRAHLTELLELLGGTVLPDDLELPEPPARELDPGLRRDILELVAEPLERKAVRRALATAIGRKRSYLDGHASSELAANAALVVTRGDDSAAAAATRLLGCRAGPKTSHAPDHLPRSPGPCRRVARPEAPTRSIRRRARFIGLLWAGEGRGRTRRLRPVPERSTPHVDCLWRHLGGIMGRTRKKERPHGPTPVEPARTAKEKSSGKGKH